MYLWTSKNWLTFESRPLPSWGIFHSLADIFGETDRNIKNVIADVSSDKRVGYPLNFGSHRDLECGSGRDSPWRRYALSERCCYCNCCCCDSGWSTSCSRSDGHRYRAYVGADTSTAHLYRQSAPRQSPTLRRTRCVWNLWLTTTTTTSGGYQPAAPQSSTWPATCRFACTPRCRSLPARWPADAAAANLAFSAPVAVSLRDDTASTRFSGGRRCCGRWRSGPPSWPRHFRRSWKWTASTACRASSFHLCSYSSTPPIGLSTQSDDHSDTELAPVSPARTLTSSSAIAEIPRCRVG